MNGYAVLFAVVKLVIGLERIRVLKNYPLYCPKCKQDTLVNAKELYITVIKEPDAQTQSQ